MIVRSRPWHFDLRFREELFSLLVFGERSVLGTESAFETVRSRAWHVTLPDQGIASTTAKTEGERMYLYLMRLMVLVCGEYWPGPGT